MSVHNSRAVDRGMLTVHVAFTFGEGKMMLRMMKRGKRAKAKEDGHGEGLRMVRNVDLGACVDETDEK